MLLFLGNENDDTENNMMTAVDRNNKCFIIVALISCNNRSHRHYIIGNNNSGKRCFVAVSKSKCEGRRGLGSLSSSLFPHYHHSFDCFSRGLIKEELEVRRGRCIISRIVGTLLSSLELGKL